MKTSIPLNIQRQPDDISCGPTCLHAVYQYYNDSYTLEQVISEIPMLEGGGTLAVHLGAHALRSGYLAKLYTYNLYLFDPTWFYLGSDVIRDRLRQQLLYKDNLKLHVASQAYMEFLDLGGTLHFEDLSTDIFSRYLKQSIPILTGLSATFLYQSPRIIPGIEKDDDIRGEPCGHFVVLSGYDEEKRIVEVADPYVSNLAKNSNVYEVSVNRMISAILLGILTYDGNLLIIQPRAK